MSHWPTPKRQSIFERLRAISIVLVFCSYFLLSIYIRSHLEGSDSRLWLKTPFVLGSGYIALQAVDLLAKPYLIYFSYSIPEKVGYLIYSPQFAAGPVEKSRSLISALRSPIIVSNSKRLESSFKYLIPGPVTFRKGVTPRLPLRRPRWRLAPGSDWALRLAC